METNFKGISLSYQTAPLEVRGLFSFDEQASKHLLLQLKEQLDIQEAFILSTCNRTEVYYNHDVLLNQELIALLIKDQPVSADLFQSFEQADSAVQHLFEVAVGLQSQVLGDLQISNQVKNAYQWSADIQMAGPFIHRLMHTIFFTNKKIVQETSFRDGAASVSYAATELIEEVTGADKEKQVLVLGLGEIGQDSAKNLISKGYTKVAVINRTFEKSEAFANDCQVELKIYPFESLQQAINESDVVISSVSVQTPLLTKSYLQTCQIVKHKLFVDLSVPRSIEHSAEEIPGVMVYDLDEISQRAHRALEMRKASVPQVKQILEEAIAEFNDWTKEMLVSPVINRLKSALEQIRYEEVARFQKQLNEDQIRLVESITKNMMQKIIKLPALQLKAACKRGEAETLIDVINDLFNLNEQEIKA